MSFPLVSLISSLFWAPPAAGPTFTKLYDLRPAEGVFAYARISPDGKQLAYASELLDNKKRVVSHTVTLVDLTTKKVLYTERGIDAYFSTDGERIIYSGTNGVTLRHASGKRAFNPNLDRLGDYYSWGMRDGRNLILTIQSNYYYLDGDKALAPAKVSECPGIGRGSRPLLSKDGMRITTFVQGTVVVRNLTDCDYTFDTGLQGAKADFSWDSRYIAFHLARENPALGYDIVVIDTKDRTIRRVTKDLKGSSYFPSWTKDGRISFRYDGDDFRGFMMITDPLLSPALPLPKTSNKLPAKRSWQEIFPETPLPRESLVLVMLWAPWSAHMPDALAAAQKTSQSLAGAGKDFALMTAVDPASHPADVARQRNGITTLRQIPISPIRMSLTEARNQIPSSLLFRNGVVIDQHLGPMTMAETVDWVVGHQTVNATQPRQKNSGRFQ